jgi:putative salt-induced outer membrane protein
LKQPLALTIAACLATPCAFAVENFSGEASVGFLNTTGNTRTRSLNSKLSAAYQVGDWTHTGRLTALNAQQDGTTTDERYSAGYKAAWALSETDYLFGSLDYENDRFAGVTERLTEGVGYGRHILRGPTHILDAELGVGATQQKLATDERNDSIVGLFNAKYQWKISDTSSFTQSLKVEQSQDNTFINPVSELKLVIAGNLFTTLGYEVRTNTEVPAGTAKTDTLTSVNLGYSFGKKP